MTNKSRIWKRGALLGIVVAVLGSTALAAFWGSSTVAGHLGTTGKTFRVWGDPGGGAGGVDGQKLTVFAYDDSAGNIAGTINYRADNSVAALAIDRVRCCVRDPSVTSTWTVLCDVTAPDSRISNGSPLNTFTDTFSVPDLSGGMEFAIEVWDDNTLSAPAISLTFGARQ
jgi:hypothetical protein